MFSLAPKVTKGLLLEHNSQERYFEHYLGVPVKPGLFCSPPIIRKDRTPTCAFYKTAKGVLKFKDFAGPSFDFVSCVMHIYGCSYYKALQTIANDFGIIKNNYPKNVALMPYTNSILKETKQSNVQVEIQDYDELTLSWWRKFGILEKTLHKFRVFSIKHVFLNGNYHTSSASNSPIFGYFGGINSDKLELWRIYMPTKIKYRFLNNWKQTMIQGYKQLPKKGSHCFIIKSLKDVMNLSEYGLTAVAPVSENVLISESVYGKLQSRFDSNVIVFFDNDLPGVKGAHRYKKMYPDVRCVFIKRRYSKDITDLYKKVSGAVYWTIIEELEEIIENKDIRSTKHFYIF